MLLSFSVENWMSFRDKVTFSMIATEEDQHNNKVCELREHQTRALPIAAIYGGNASGKSSLFKALAFAKDLCVNGTMPDAMIRVQPFLLNNSMAEAPSRFCFVLLSNGSLYEFSFAVTYKAVLEEKLVEITGKHETVLYHRSGGKIQLEQSLAKEQFINFAFRATRDNQLFLHNSVDVNVDNFKPVYNWFRDTLEIISADSCFGPFGSFAHGLAKDVDGAKGTDGNQLYSRINKLLPYLDIGITRLDGEEFPFRYLPLPESQKAQLQRTIRNGMAVRVTDPLSKKRFVVTRQNGELIAEQLVAYHKRADGTECKFELEQESNGSLHLIDLLPAFLDLASENATKVYVIDDIDRSLHTQLKRSLLEAYLKSCSTQSRKQLLLATHDVILMDQELLRQDEIWFAERDDSEVSHLFSLSDYKDARTDKDIRKSYLMGRMGGIPCISSSAIASLFSTD